MIKDTETNQYLDPMTDEQIEAYAQTVADEMDTDKVISGTGMDFITREDNIPCDEDQERIMTRIEEIRNATDNQAEPATGEDSSADQAESTASDTEAKEEAAPDANSEAEVPVEEVSTTDS